MPTPTNAPTPTPLPVPPTYDEIFNQTILTSGSLKPDIDYNGKGRIHTCTIREDGGIVWSDDFISAEYESKSPDDVGGILIVYKEHRSSGVYENGVYAFNVNYYAELYDPHENVYLGARVVLRESGAPSLTNSTTHFYLYPEPHLLNDLEEWVRETWAAYFFYGSPPAKPPPSHF